MKELINLLQEEKDKGNGHVPVTVSLLLVLCKVADKQREQKKAKGSDYKADTGDDPNW